MATNGRGILRDRPEEDWFDATPEQLRGLAAWATRQGHSEATVNGLVGWLTRGATETASIRTATRNRGILREYGPPRRPRTRPASKKGKRETPIIIVMSSTRKRA